MVRGLLQTRWSNISARYKIDLSVPFLSSFKELKRRFYKKQAKRLAELEDLIRRVVQIFEHEPHLSTEELRRFSSRLKEIQDNPSNSTEFDKSWECKKLYFVCPGLRRAASMGRLIYAVDPNESTVYLALIYNHVQHPKRPPDGLMNDTWKQIKQRGNGNG